MKFTIEMLEKAKTAKTAEELLELAKAEDIEITADEAAKYFADLHKSGELSDEELENAAGGGCLGYDEVQCCAAGFAKSKEEVVFLFAKGQYVEVKGGKYNTYRAQIIERRVDHGSGGWYPSYQVKYTSGGDEWVYQNNIQIP